MVALGGAAAGLLALYLFWNVVSVNGIITGM
jgi:hypothetical protein